MKRSMKMEKERKIVPVFFYSLMVFLFLSFGIDTNNVYFFRTINSVSSSTFMFIGIFVLCWFFYPYLTMPHSKVFYILSFLVCGFFSLASVIGVFFSAGTGMREVLSDWVNILGTFVAFIAGFFLFFGIIQLIGSLQTLWADIPSFKGVQRFFSFMYKDGCFWKCLLIMAIFWIPQIIIRYPGILTTDTVNSLKQYWEVKPETTQHPILYTVLVGFLMDLGVTAAKPALSFFILILLQTVLMLLVLAYTIHTMNALKVPAWMCTLTLVFFTCAPIFSAYATTAIIDTFYGTFFLLLMDELAWYVFAHKHFRKSVFHYLMCFAAVFGLHFRHNGIYIALGVFVFAVIMELYFCIGKKQSLVYSIIFLAVLLLPALGGKALSNRLYEKFDAQKMSVRAMLALPLQQTARCIVVHGDEIGEDIMEPIQKVLTWEKEEYAEIYQPLTFNGVKRGFNLDATTEDVINYLKAWGKLLIRYPGTCISATLNQTYFLFSPKVINQRYYDIDKVIRIKGFDFSDINDRSSFQQRACAQLKRYYTEFAYYPGLGLMINQGFTDFILLAICIYALTQKNGKILFLSVPLLLTLAITFVGPTVSGHPRYTYPIMYSLPLLFGLFITYSKNPFNNPKICHIKKYLR